MEFLRRFNEAPTPRAPQGEPDGAAGLRHAQEETDALLRAADDVINRMLSRNSSQYLQETRQHGGQ